MATVTERKGSYRIKVSCGYDIHGKQVVQYKNWRPPENMTARQIKKELDRQIILFEEECKKGQVTASIKFEALAEEWFEEYAKLNLKKSSFTRARTITKRVYPAFGHMKLDKITSRDIQKFINDLAVNGRNLQTGKPISRKTAVHHLSFISSIFTYAIRMDLVKDNPCTRVTVPKGEKKEKEIYTIEEIERIFELLETAPLVYRTFIILAVYSGFRRGEMCGLEWDDIDWEHNVISIRRTANYSPLYGSYLDTTKTRRSERSSKLSPIVMDLLRQLKSEQEHNKEMCGDKWQETNRVFVHADGAPLHINRPYRWLKDFCRKNDIRFCDIHSLRHFHASVLIFSGVDPVSVSADLGHTAVSTTTSIYCHMFQEAQARTSDIIANALNFSKNKSENRPAV